MNRANKSPERSDEVVLLDEISRKLTELTAVVGLARISDSKEGRIKYLTGFGLSNSEISRLTGYPEGTVAPIRAGLSKPKVRKEK